MPRLTAEQVLIKSRGWTVLQRYLAATLLVALITIVRWLLTPVLESSNYLLFEFVVVISAIFFDRGSSVWATLLSAFVVAYFFVPPPNTLALSGPQVGALLIFVAVSLVLGTIAEMTRTLTGRLHDSVQELRVLERQKDALYREMNHRARNNLQLIGSTLSLQVLKATTPEARASLESALNRIKGIGRVDELLQRAHNGAVIDARQYLTDLAEDIRGSLLAVRPVRFSYHAESYPLARDIAEAIGIAVNELVTNALKYAFPEDRPGHISIAFYTERDDLVLRIEDDGRGCSEEANSGTGLRLITSLVGWCSGTMVREDAQPGCRVVVRIPKRPADEMMQAGQQALPL